MDQRQGALNLLQVADLDGEAHVGPALFRLGIDADDVDLLAGEHVRDIAQQALAVVGVDHDVGGEDAGGLAAPVGPMTLFGMERRQVGEIGTVGAVDRHTCRG